MMESIREFELEKPTNQIEAPCSELVKCNTDRGKPLGKPKPSQRDPKGVRRCDRSTEDSWRKSTCTETVSEDGNSLKKAVGEPLLDLLQCMLENLGWDTHEIDCRARKQGYLWEGLVDKTKVVQPLREDLISGVKMGDEMIDGLRALKQGTSPCPVREVEGQSNYRQREKRRLGNIFFVL